eukprot:CAMPEP_0181021082 /NCGR_PEP_ID=MMETSP1070-20121207/793_1 /TAXON_ID=265543 /ORGANISM="Minutocellus polymorphus, Strain NH13" /LENGTH=138 /DNA_ID=CAMNT_0023097937 /DNA_START=216 /DNA_END=632 /DNA_ORIENTATION=+
MEHHERRDDSFVTTTTASSSNTTNNNNPGVPKRSLLDDSAVTSSSRQLSESVLQEAREKIIKAREDRHQSKLPKRLIPLVEMCLPPGYRLSAFEEDAQKTYQKLFGSCSSSACLGNVDVGHVDRKDEDGVLFEDAEER